MSTLAIVARLYGLGVSEPIAKEAALIIASKMDLSIVNPESLSYLLETIAEDYQIEGAECIATLERTII